MDQQPTKWMEIVFLSTLNAIESECVLELISLRWEDILKRTHKFRITFSFFVRAMNVSTNVLFCFCSCSDLRNISKKGVEIFIAHHDWQRLKQINIPSAPEEEKTGQNKTHRPYSVGRKKYRITSVPNSMPPPLISRPHLKWCSLWKARNNTEVRWNPTRRCSSRGRHLQTPSSAHCCCSCCCCCTYHLPHWQLVGATSLPAISSPERLGPGWQCHRSVIEALWKFVS